jgi:membrane protein YqaA with SNARE-associated domain
MDTLANPVLWLTVLLLTVAGVAFSYLKYEFGKGGWAVVLEKYPHFGQERVDRVTRLYGQHGSLVLLSTAIPGIDTLVTVGAGAVGVGRGPFLIWVTIAKLARFSILAVLFAGLFNLTQ